MNLDCIRIWKFDDAPAELKLGYGGADRPLWLALVPRSLKGSDLDEAIHSHSEPDALATYQTESGDIVYTGSARADVLTKVMVLLENQGRQ